MRRPPLLIVVASILALSGCGGDDDRNPTGCDSGTMSVSDWPVRVGNWWKYQRTDWGVGYADVDTYTVRVVEQLAALGGHVACRFVEEPSGEIDWFIVIDGEVRNYDVPPTETDPYLVFLKDPIQEGTAWAYNVDPEGATSYQARITKLCVSIQVPAGALENCVRMEVQPFLTMHFRPDIGMVEAVAGDEESGTADRLISYQIAR